MRPSMRHTDSHCSDRFLPSTRLQETDGGSPEQPICKMLRQSMFMLRRVSARPVCEHVLMLTSERDLDIDGFGIAQSGNHITANLRSVDAHRALAGALHGDAVGHAAEHARHGQLVDRSGRCGSMARPSSVGRTPSRYCDTSTNVHAAVPVSQEFLPSPGVAASGPATIWQ